MISTLFDIPSRNFNKLMAAVLLLPMLFAGPDPALAQQKNGSAAEKNFEAFWSIFHDYYAHFQTRKVDWQAQYDKYRPLVTEKTSEDELFVLLNEMVEPLRDGHVVISKTGDLPASAKYTDFHKRFPTKAAVNQLKEVRTNTLAALAFEDFTRFDSRQYQIGGYASSDKYGYLQLNGFGGMPLKTFERQLDDMLVAFKDKKAIIIDIRINGGGSPDFVGAVVKRLIDRRLLVCHGQSKRAGGPADFSPLQAYYTEPAHKHLIKPILLLTSGASISAADHFAMYLKGLPYVTIMGERTAGMFSSMMGKKLPNGWELSLSNDMFFSRDMLCYEGMGVPVDVAAINTQQDVISGKDTVLLQAVALLDTKFR